MKWAYLALPALAGLFLCFHFPVWNRHLLSIGKYHRLEKIEASIKGYGWLDSLLRGSEILIRSESGELVYYNDGIGGFTTVLKYALPLGNFEYTLANICSTMAKRR